MNKIRYILATVMLMFAITGCDRSDSEINIEVFAQPSFDLSTAAGVQAKKIYDTYGLNCQWNFSVKEFAYQLTGMDATAFTPVDDMSSLAQFLTTFENKALKLFPNEVIKRSFAKLYICNELRNSYMRYVSTTTNDASTTARTSTELIELLPMKIKTLDVALGFAGSLWATADKNLLQLRWVQAIVETMLNNSPSIDGFTRLAIINVESITGTTIYRSNYRASSMYGWYCVQNGYKNEWGLLDPPNKGLSSIRFKRDGITEVQAASNSFCSRWYNNGYSPEMDFATYASFLMLKPNEVTSLYSQFPLIRLKAEAVINYFKTHFNFDIVGAGVGK